MLIVRNVWHLVFAVTCACSRTGLDAPRPDGGTTDGAAVSPTPGALTAGDNFTCTLNSDKTVWCWGDGTHGATGNGVLGTFASAQPTTVTNGQRVTAGDQTACAIFDQGHVSCWGYGADGQLANGTTVSVATPIAVPSVADATEIAASAHATCILRSAGNVVCAGRDSAGELAQGAITNQQYPNLTSTTMSVVDSIGGTTGLFMCAISNGDLSCWGSSHNTLGDGITVQSGSPINVETPSPAVSLAVGWENACIVLNGGALSCWGTNEYGQLGDGTTTDSARPVLATIGDVDAVCVGFAHSCVLTQQGSVKCVGQNAFGQLGTGKATNLPVTQWQTAIESDVTAITCGYAHSCARARDGSVWCWGKNDVGQVGVAITPLAIEPTPVRVVGTE